MKYDKMVIILYILLFLFIPLISPETNSITVLTESKELLPQSKIKLKVNKEGSLKIINNTYVPNPNEIRIGAEIKRTNIDTITVDDIENEIELIWNDKLTTTNSIFYSLEYIIEIDLSEFDSSEVTDMSLMFSNCIALKSINFGNIDTSNVKDMNTMFYNCYSLTSLDVSNFETSKVTAMNTMFYGCHSLESLDLSKWNTQSNTKFTSTFRDCFNLKYLNLDGIKTNSVYIFNYMFVNCFSLNHLNLSHFVNSASIRFSAAYMFYNCTSLITLDISNFAVCKSATMACIMEHMFTGCINLRYVNFKSLYEYTYNNLFSVFEIFDDTPQNMVICLPDGGASNIKSKFSEKECGIIDCSDNWEEKQKKNK